MSDMNPPTPPPAPEPAPPVMGQPAAGQPVMGHPAPAGAMMPAPAAAPMMAPPLGQIRSTGTCILLTIVTFGIYTWYWYYKTHEEMKRHSGAGIGGGLALVLAIFAGIVMPFVTSSEVGGLYQRRAQQPPVSAATGLWALLLGWFFFVGLFVWFIKTNDALNSYWRLLGAR